MALEKMAVRDVVNHYGPRTIDQSKGGVLPGSGSSRELVYTFDYDNLPVAGDSELEMQIPAYAKIIKATLEVLEPFAGGTSYNVGLVEGDGTPIDADGLIAGLLLADIDARGDYAVGAGALVGASIGAAAGEVEVAATGTFTAGKARLVVEYAPEGAGA